MDLLSPPGWNVSSWRECCNVEEHATQLATKQSHESDNSLVFMIDSDSCIVPVAPRVRAMEKGAERSPECPEEVAAVEYGCGSVPCLVVLFKALHLFPIQLLISGQFSNSMSHIIIKNILDTGAKLGAEIYSFSL